MKPIPFFIIQTLLWTSCALSNTNHTNDKRRSYDFFISAPTNSIHQIIKRFGPPSQKGSTENLGIKLAYLRYADSSGEYYADFFINEQNNKVVEKVFSPKETTNDYKLSHFKNNRFKGIYFEKIPIKCRHHKEVLLINKKKSILIFSDESEFPTVKSVSFSTPQIVELRLKEIKQRKCRYHNN